MSAVRVVLLRPKNPQNAGAAARALKNFGLAQWALVQPAFALEDAEAHKVAVQSHDVLRAAATPASLEDAVRDCVWVVGTSSRRVRGKRSLSPRAFAKEALDRAASGPVALVFGEESSGLSNEEVERCQDLSSIPTADEQPSLNLAQAVLLYCYELRLAGLEAQPARPAPAAALATDGALEELSQALGAALRAHRFLRPPERHALKDLLAPLHRAKLTAAEAKLWRSALASLAEP